MKKWKSYIAYAMAGCMILGNVPVQTFAEEQTEITTEAEEVTTESAEEMSTEVLEQETTAVTYDEVPEVTTEVFQEEWEATTEQKENRAGTSDFTDIENPIFIQDSCGVDAFFRYEIGTDTLYIMGQGEMNGYEQDDDNRPPWYEYRNDIKHVVIDSVTGIGMHSFDDMTQVASVELPDTLTKIGFAAFRGCQALTSIVIPDSVTVLGGHALSGCTNLTSVTLPKNLTAITYGLFYGDTALTSIQIPDSVTSFEGECFTGCSNLRNINIPAGLTEIGDQAFRNTGLTSLILPENVTYIDSYAFLDCSDLKEVTILSPKYNIGDYAFGYRMKGVDSYEKIDSFTIKAYHGTQGETYAKDNGFTFIALDGEENATSGQCGNDIVWNYDTKTKTLTLTGKGAMYDYTDVEDDYSGRTLPPWTSYIDEIQTIMVSEGITTVGDCAFGDAKSLNNISLPSTLKTIGTWGLSSTGLKAINLPDGIEEFGYQAFGWNHNLTSINLPKNLKDIGFEAFNHCTALKKVTFKGGIEMIRKYSFVYCDNIEEVILAEGTKTIEEYVFYNMKLKSITIPKSVTTIEEYTLGYRLGEDDSPVKVEGYTIKGYSGTAAETYAKVNGFTFYALDKAEDIKNETVAITSAVLQKKGILLKWSGSKCADAYKIYRKTGKGGYTLVKSLEINAATLKGYLDTSVKSGNSYTYKIIGYYKGIASKTKEKTVYYLAEPNVTLKNTNAGISVVWTKVAGASGYYIYRKVGNGKYTKVTTAKSTAKSYTDKKAVAGSLNTYKVYAYKSSPKAQSSYTEQKIFYLKPTKLSLTRKNKNATSIELKWTKVAGAKGYYIYRKSGKGSYQKIATIENASTLKYTDKTVKRRVKYTYYVVAYNGKDVSSYTAKTK